MPPRHVKLSTFFQILSIKYDRVDSDCIVHHDLAFSLVYVEAYCCTVFCYTGCFDLHLLVYRIEELCHLQSPNCLVASNLSIVFRNSDNH
ncbi:unnamed protein product [Schistosoma spindalis]|nr:unnamed protein product [Schistosoma spindale]